MRPTEYAPAPLLSGFVKCFWTTQRLFEAPRDTFQILPDTYLELIFSAGTCCFLLDQPQVMPMPSCYLVKLLEKPFTIRAEGTLRVLGVRLYAWSWQALFQEEPSTFSGSIVRLNSRLLDLEPAISRYLQQNQWQEAVSCLEQTLVDLYTPVLPLVHRRALLLRQVSQHTDPVSPTELTQQFGLSTRQVQRLLKASSGISPKMLLRLNRFEQARNRIWQEPKSNLTALGYELGYADQAHFSRDFRAFCHYSPRQFARQVGHWQRQA